MNIEEIKLQGFAGIASVKTSPIKTPDGERVLSNGEYIEHVCNYTNPMIGPFIIQAVNTFCDTVIESGDEMIAKENKQKEEDGSIPLFSTELWVECAKFLRLQNAHQYGEIK